MKIRNYFILLSLISFSVYIYCRKPYALDTIDIEKARLNEVPVLLPVEELVEFYGPPLSKDDSSSFTKIKGENNFLYSSWWKYKSIYYRIYNDSAFVSQINFRSSNIDQNFELRTPEISLSKNTTLEEIKKTFPNSYRNRNIDLKERFPKGSAIITLKDKFPQERRIYPSTITLLFSEGYLVMLSYRKTPVPNEDQFTNGLAEAKRRMKKKSKIWSFYE